MAKPIFIIETPLHYTDEELDNFHTVMGRNLSDYHILVVRSNVDRVAFKDFNEKYFSDIDTNNLVVIPKSEYDKLKFFRDSNTGLYAIDHNPKDVNYKWILKHVFRIK